MDDNKKKRVNYFALTAPIVGVIAIIAVIKPELFTNYTVKVTTFFYNIFDWLVMWMPLAALIFGLYFAFSKYGKIKLGGVDAQPEYSMFSWMSMLFTAGIGVGIVFYGPIEAVWHYFKSPIGLHAQSLIYDGAVPIEAQSVAMENAMSLALWVWGIPAWSLYMFGGLIIAYFAYQHKAEFSPSAPIEIGFSRKKWAKPLGVFILVVAIISIALSVSSSIAMATTQVSSGFHALTGVVFENPMRAKIIILVVIVTVYTLGSILPINKGMNAMGSITMYTAIGLMLYIFLTGPTHYFISVMVNTFGRIITDTIPFSFEMYLFQDRYWVTWFPMAYWVWWITWTPFVGVFLAKISKGRTIRTFILSSILLPSGFMLAWFSIFSGFSLLDTLEGSGRIAEIANGNNYEGVIYIILEYFPFSNFTKIITIFLFSAFVVTTVVSAAISLGIMTSKDGKSESKGRAAMWCIFMAFIGFAVIVTGKIEGIKAVGSFAGFPFIFILFLMGAAFLRQIRKDNKNVNKGDKQ